MDIKKVKKIGFKLTYLLRHDPEELSMDYQGYVKVIDLINKLNISKIELDWIVENNNKKRFSYLENDTLIRAEQGHNKKLNIKIDIEESPRIDFLYHGTSSDNLKNIMKEGLTPQSRKHVHMSKDIETALQVGSRKSKDVIILKIHSAKMRSEGVKIYISNNNVYLTDYVDPKYISLNQ